MRHKNGPSYDGTAARNIYPWDQWFFGIMEGFAQR